MTELISIQFDQYQRYGLASKIINRLRGKRHQLRILEVGANIHKLLGRFLPNDLITYLDIEIPEGLHAQDVIVGDATQLDLPDQSFDVVVALDVYEHIPPEKRTDFLLNVSRVSKLGTIIAAPFNEPGVEKAEEVLLNYWSSIFGDKYRWLEEHQEYGLPNLKLTVNLIEELGFYCNTIGHGDIDLWLTFMKAHFSEVYASELQPLMRDLYKLYNHSIAGQDFASDHTYRNFMLVSRSPSSILSEFQMNRSQDDEIYRSALKQSLKLFPMYLNAARERDKAEAERDKAEAERDKAEAERDKAEAERDKAEAERDELTKSFIQSRYWRVTAPLRFIMRRLRSLNPYCLFFLKLFSFASKRPISSATILWKTLREGGVAGVRLKLEKLKNKALDASYEEWIKKYDTIDEVSRRKIRTAVARMPSKPLISIVMPVYNPPIDFLEAAIESVKSQLYTNWELCIADDASSDERVKGILQKHADEDQRIKVILRKENGHISAALNSAIELVSGEYIALMDQDDVLPEHALFWVARTIVDNPEAGLIYSDEDKIDSSGKRYDPYFKSDWNPDLFLSQNMINHLGVYRTSLVRSLGGFREGYEGAQDYDLAMRVSELIEAYQIIHIPRVLYHWRSHSTSTALSLSTKNYAMLAGRKVVSDHLDRIGISGSVETLYSGYYRVRYKLPSSLPMVSLIIPTRNGLVLIKQAVDSILKKTIYDNYEIIIIDNGSDDPNVLAYFNSVVENPRIRVVRDESPFNYSALNNRAVELAKGDYVGLINNDIEVINPDWLNEMIGIAIQEGVGAVGARLWYPNDTIQHAGVVLGIGGVAGHAFKNLPKGHKKYFGRSELTQTLSAVTGACLLVKKSIYKDVGGLDELNLTVAFNDVDFCLRVREKGYKNIWTPYAELYHHESASRGLEDNPEKIKRFNDEVDFMKSKWGEALLNDPAYNPNLTLMHEDFSLAYPPRVGYLYETDK